MALRLAAVDVGGRVVKAMGFGGRWGPLAAVVASAGCRRWGSCRGWAVGLTGCCKGEGLTPS